MNMCRAICLVMCLTLPMAGTAALAREPIPPVPHVDLSRYMGRWFVIAFIPTRYGRHARNMVEFYRLRKNGQVCTSLWFRDGGSDGKIKRKHELADVVADQGNAAWKVHVLWLAHAQYLVGWLAPDYSQVIVARDKRDYMWFMARKPTVSDADYQAMTRRVKAMGYDVSDIRRVPQQWTPAQLKNTSFEQPCD